MSKFISVKDYGCPSHGDGRYRQVLVNISHIVEVCFTPIEKNNWAVLLQLDDGNLRISPLCKTEAEAQKHFDEIKAMLLEG